MYITDLSQTPIRIRLCGAVAKHHADQVGRQLKAALVGDDPAPLWVDMSRVEFMDNTGLSILLSTCALAKQRGRSMVLYQVSAPVRLVLELTGLDQRLNLMSAGVSDCSATVAAPLPFPDL